MAINLRAVIEEAVRRALEPTLVDAINVEERRDSIDEDALYITVDLPPETPLVGGKTYLAAMTRVSDALLALGERRFPYVRLDHVGEDAPEEADWSRAPTP